MNMLNGVCHNVDGEMVNASGPLAPGSILLTGFKLAVNSALPALPSILASRDKDARNWTKIS